MVENKKVMITTRTPTDIMDLIRFICDFYNSYRDLLGLSHEDARSKTEFTYNDLWDWLYGEK